MQIGIDKIVFQAPAYYLELHTLAKAREVDSLKYEKGFMQSQMAVCPLDEDIVTLAAEATQKLLQDENVENIAMFLFATESSVDASKAAGLYVHGLLDLPKKMRVIELKQACYSSAAALSMAKDYIASHPEKKVLVLCSDIAKYGLGTSGEVTQGAGAVAMLVSANPRLLVLQGENTYLSEDIMDFWRPYGELYPSVDGKLSIETYLRFFETVYADYLEQNKKTTASFDAFCFHMPYGKLAYKAMQQLLDKYVITEEEKEKLEQRFFKSTHYNKRIGNIYTGSLFLSLLSLLETDHTLKAGDTIGLFAYGSGATGEFFSLQLVDGYQEHLEKAYHESKMQERKELSFEEYEAILKAEKDSRKTLENKPFVFLGLEEKKRQYQKR